MAEAEPWVFDAVQGFLKGPEWSVAIWDFIDDNCIVFDSEDENKLAYHDIFNSFRELVDGLLTYHLEDLCISQESFAKLCAEYGSTEAGKDTLEQILAVDDFISFKQMMVKRNIELELESLKELQALSDGVKSGEVQAEPEADEDDFEEQTRKAIANSLLDQEAAGVYTDVSDQEIEKLREDQEAADIKLAIAMSIQMDQQEAKEQSGEQKPVVPAPVETRPPAPTPAPAPAPPPKQHRMAPVKAPLGALAPLPMPRQTPFVSQAPTSTQLAAQEQYQRAQESAAAVREEAQKAKEAQQQQMQAAGGGASAAEVRARAEHLKKQRDLILAKRKKERGESVVQSEPVAPASSNASVPPSSALRQGAGYSDPDPHAAAKAQLSVQLASSMKSALLGEDSTTLDLQQRMQKDARKVDLELTKQQLREEAQAVGY